MLLAISSSEIIAFIPIAIMILAIIHIARLRQVPKEGLKEGIATFCCRSETPVFTTRSGLFCILNALDDGLEIKVAFKNKPRFLIKYEDLYTFRFDGGNPVNHNEIRDILPQQLPDRVLLEYKSDDGTMNKIMFIQTQEDKIINQKALLLNDIFIFVNKRISQNDQS